MTQALWQASKERIEQSNLMGFMRAVERDFKVNIADYRALYQWSIENPQEFWQAIWRFGGVRGTLGAVALRDGYKMPGAQWFPEARLNFAENLLRTRDDADAI